MEAKATEENVDIEAIDGVILPQHRGQVAPAAVRSLAKEWWQWQKEFRSRCNVDGRNVIVCCIEEKYKNIRKWGKLQETIRPIRDSLCVNTFA